MRRWLYLPGACATLLVATAAPVRGQAPTTSYSASASAAGVRTRVVAEAFPLTPTPVDAGGPVAQAAASSNGAGLSLAAFPYPGDIAVNYSGTVAGGAAPTFSQLPLPPDIVEAVSSPPPYPFVARADADGQQEMTTPLPAGELRASADRGVASASGETGAGDVGYRSGTSSYVGPEDAIVVARSESYVDGLVAGPLRVGSIVARAEVTMHPDGSLERATTFDVSAASVGGVAVAIGPDGLDVGGTALPVPEGVDDLLAQSGFEVAYLAAEETPDGVISAGVQLTYPVDFGAGIGDGAFIVTFGQASASISGAPMPSVRQAPIVDATAPPDDGGAAVAPRPSASVSSTPTAVVASGPATGPASPAVALVAGGAGHDLFDASTFYPILLAGGLLLVVLTRVLQIYGMRPSWTS